MKVKDEDKLKGILTTRKSGDYTFEYFRYYFSDIKINSYCFEIWNEKDRASKKYSFILEILGNETDLKVMDMYACDYRGRSISIPIILKAKQLFSRRIVSSSNSHSSRSGEANWRRY